MGSPKVTPGRVAFAAAAAVFAIARALPFAHARVGLGLDSFDYINLAHSKSLGSVLAARRPPTYLIVMKALSGRWQFVTWAQFVIAMLAWVLLAAVAARVARTGVGRVAAVAAVFLVGSCLDVAQWDRLIGTESLSLSLGVLLVAASYWLSQRVTPARAAVVGVIALVWGLLRDANAIVVGMMGVGLAVWVLARRSRVRARLLVLAGACLAVLALSVASADVGARWEQPMQNVVTFRVLSSPERRAFFLDHGLPLTDAEADRIAGRCVNPAGVLLCREVTDPAFYRWIDHDARSTYLASWFEFPATTAWEPLAHVRRMVGERFPLAGITFTGLSDGVARSIETVAFPRSPRVILAWLLADGVALAVVVRRRGWIGAATIPVALIGLTYPHLWAVWTGDAIELTRHGLAVSVQLRLGLWLLTAAIVDGAGIGRGRAERTGVTPAPG